MAFPTIPTVAAGRVLTTVGTTCASGQTFPNLSSLTKNSGDLLIAIVAIYDGNSTDAEFSSWGGGFTEFGDFATTTSLSIGCAYKWSTGSETGTFTVTSADTSTNDYATILLSIPGAHATTPPEAGGYASGTAAAADPGSLNPSGWDVEDTLWIAVAGCGETSTAGAFTGLASAPSTFSDYADTGISADAVGGIEAAVAFLQSAAASVDPGTFGTDTSNTNWGAITIAVRPAPATHDTSGALPGGSAAIAGTATHIGTHPTSGALTGQGAVVTGTANSFTVITTTGALTGQGSAIAGSADRFRAFDTSGALAGAGAAIAGSAEVSAGVVSHDTSGALAGAGSSVVGASTLTPAATGCTFAVLDADGNSFSVSTDILDADGNSFTVGIAANDSDGNSFDVGTCPPVVTPTASVSVGLGGKPARSTKRGKKGEKLVVIEEVDDVIEEVEEILDQIEEVVKKEPKKKGDTPAIRPREEVTAESVFDWIAYYESMIMRLRDQQRAQSLQSRLTMASLMAYQAIQRAEAERLAYEAFMLDEDEVAILLMVA